MVAEALRLEGFFMTLDNWGLTDVMLPFLLIFFAEGIVLIFEKATKKIIALQKIGLQKVVAVIFAVVSILLLIPIG